MAVFCLQIYKPQSKQDFKESSDKIKKLVPPNASEATGHGVKIKVQRNGSKVRNMQKLGDSTSNLIPKPKLNAKVHDNVSNENNHCSKPRQYGSGMLKGSLSKNQKIHFIIVNMQAWHSYKG